VGKSSKLWKLPTSLPISNASVSEITEHSRSFYYLFKRGGYVKRFPILFVILAYIFLGIQIGFSKALTAEKKADIEKMFRLTGASTVATAIGNQLVQQTVSSIQAAHPDLPVKVLNIIREEMRKAFAEVASAKGGMFDLMIEIYHRHLSHEEIKGLIIFYESSLGKKLIEVNPLITQESLAMGMAWGQRLSPILDQRIKERLQREDIKL
jgi:hypothetical protein